MLFSTKTSWNKDCQGIDMSGTNLDNKGSIRYWPKRALFEKGAPKTSPPPIQSLALHQYKALHNFHKRGQRPIAGRIKCLD